MKDTRKLSVISVIYFIISLVMLLFVCFGCESSNDTYTRTCHTYQEMDSVVCYDSRWETYEQMIKEGENFVDGGLDNFVLQSDFGIVEFENGQLIYTSEK